MVSTMASVDRESVAKRPCFLCAENLPAEEEGLQFDEDFTIYCNPFPIIDKHLTIVHRSHGPQHIRGVQLTVRDHPFHPGATDLVRQLVAPMPQVPQRRSGYRAEADERTGWER